MLSQSLCILHRESYDLMKREGIKCVPAKLDKVFENPQSWEALSVLGILH